MRPAELHFGHRMSPSEFAEKWLKCELNEKAAAQEHFCDLCHMLGAETPTEADPKGEWYAFEKGAAKHGGGNGWADVWKRSHFAWEYKKRRKNLEVAYDQLLQYREALENPPLLVVCDLDRFEIHTNFTGTKTVIHAFALKDLRDAPKEPLRVLKALMHDPGRLRPTVTRAQVTEDAAAAFAELARSIQARGFEPLKVAHFLNRVLFCLFAEDIGLLPRRVLSHLIETTRSAPSEFPDRLAELFEKMATGGKYFGADKIEWFNGGLFDDAEVIPLKREELQTLHSAAKLDWSNVEPAILGTLFERGLDPDKRSQLGAHYTDIESIRRVLEPVVMAPLERDFEATKTDVRAVLQNGGKTAKTKAGAILDAFLLRLRSVRILDPACGSGNFLYVALQLVKDLEKEASVWGATHIPGRSQGFPRVGPEIVHGLEVNGYTAELARTTVWIGEIQWMIANGYGARTEPILRKLDTIEQRDAILDVATDPKKPRAARWPDAHYIVGNPPFLGGKRLRAVLGDEYVSALFTAWDKRVPREADFVSYWHEQAREMIEKKKCKRAGLLATQAIRGGANQLVLKRIKESGDIFVAWSDLDWVVEGANVHVSTVCQDDGSEKTRLLDGSRVEVIHADLTGGAAGVADLTGVARLPENASVSFMGDTKGGPFEINEAEARRLLGAGPNPHGKPNSAVVVPWIAGHDVMGRPRNMFIIDFGVKMTEADASLYEAPFEYVRSEVKPKRVNNNRAVYAEKWWIHVEPRPALRKAIAPLDRFIVTVCHTPHRVFAWARKPALPYNALIAFARDDDYAFGVLHSRVHEVWALAKGTQLEDRPRYTPTTTFETFPFPWPLNTPDAEVSEAEAAARDAIAAAAKELDDNRSRWLNPPELVKSAPGLAPGFPDRLVPRDATAETELKKRTLTSLYNTRPAWLDLLHKQLDVAVLAAYGWPAAISESELLQRLLKLNRVRAAQSTNARLTAERDDGTGRLFTHLPISAKPEKRSLRDRPTIASAPGKKQRRAGR